MANIALLEGAVHDLVEELAQIRRWRRHQTTSPESVPLHLVKTALLAQVVIALERDSGRECDWYAVLAACTTHDLGEAVTGDPHFSLSHDPALRPGIKAHERACVAGLFQQFPQAAAQAMLAHYDLSDDESTVEGRFFRAIHHLGFIMYAAHQWLAGHFSYREVFVNIHPLILGSAEEFSSIRRLYSPLAPEVESLLEQPPP